jgi:hypothetical protein
MSPGRMRGWVDFIAGIPVLTKFKVGVGVGGTRGGVVAAMSTTLDVNAGLLGSTAGNDVAVATLGGTNTNNAGLGVHLRRITNGADWTTAAVHLAYDVDNTTDAGAYLELRPNNIAVFLGGAASLLDDTLPWMWTLDVHAGATNNTNWATVTIDTLALGNGTRDSTGAQNASREWANIWLGAGSWTLGLLHQQGPDRGQYQLTLNGTNATGFTVIEGYAAATTRNVRNNQTFTVATTARYTVALKMATKNGASTNYVGSIQALALMRTA